MGVLPLLAVAPFMLNQANQLWHLPTTKLLPFVWILLAILIGIRCRGPVTRHQVRIVVSVVLHALAVVSLGYSVATWSSNWAHLSTALFVAAWGLGRCSLRSWPEPAAWSLVILMTLPIPVLSTSLDSWLANQAATGLSMTLDNIGIYHQLESGSFTFSNGLIGVASSGSPSLGLQFLLCLAAVWGWIYQRSVIHTLVVMASVPACLLISRYCMLATNSYLFLNHIVTDFSQANFFVLSLVSFLLTVLFFFSIDRLLVALLEPVPVTDPDLLPLYAAINHLIIWPHGDPLTMLTPTNPEERKLHEEMQSQIAAERQSWLTMNWRDRKWIRRILAISSLLLIAMCAISSVAMIMKAGLPSESPWPAVLDRTSET